MAAFAVIALVLAAVGLFGVISYAVRTRRGEIGMRMALGAERRGIMRMVIGQGIVLALAGIVIGTVAALAVSGFMRSIVWGVSPTHPLVLLATGALLAAVSAAACYWPAGWASGVGSRPRAEGRVGRAGQESRAKLYPAPPGVTATHKPCSNEQARGWTWSQTSQRTSNGGPRNGVTPRAS